MIPLKFFEHLMTTSGHRLLRATIFDSELNKIIDMVGKPPPVSTREIAVLVAFSALDELVDCKLPLLIGAAFKRRAAGLESLKGVRETLVGTYRLMIPIRNEVVHRSQKNKIEVNDEFWGKILNQVRLELILAKSTCIHATNLLAYTYEDLKRSIKFFDDEAGDLPNVERLIEYPPLTRFRHTIQPAGEADILIKRMEETRCQTDDGTSIVIPDEYLLRGEFGQYLIPGEIFGSETEIHLSEMKRWEVSNEFLALAK
jgi:hypothetical protein